MTKSASYFFLFAAASLLAACSLGGAGLDTQIDDITTGSIGVPITARQLQPSDWAKIQDIVAYASQDERAGQPIPWDNEVTGSSGSLMAFAAPNDGRGLCRNFAATIQDISGIHRYRGETCKGPSDSWRINTFEAIDTQK